MNVGEEEEDQQEDRTQMTQWLRTTISQAGRLAGDLVLFRRKVRDKLMKNEIDRQTDRLYGTWRRPFYSPLQHLGI